MYTTTNYKLRSAIHQQQSFSIWIAFGIFRKRQIIAEFFTTPRNYYHALMIMMGLQESWHSLLPDNGRHVMDLAESSCRYYSMYVVEEGGREVRDTEEGGGGEEKKKGGGGGGGVFARMPL